MRSSSINKYIIPLLFIICTAVYLTTLCPTVYVGDSGELISAAYNTGTAHPPGYPVYIITGKLFCMLAVISNIAYRLNLLSAIFASLTVILLYLSIFKFLSLSENKSSIDLKTKYIFSLLSSLLFAFSPLFWSQSVFAEVFTLNTFIAILVFFAVLHKNVLLGSFLFGIGMGNHHTIIFCVPIYLYTAWIIDNKLFSLRNMLFCALLVFLALTLYLNLLFAGLSNSKINWGDPESFSTLLRIFKREDYGGSFNLNLIVNSITDPNKLIHRFYVLIRSYYNQFFLIGFILSIIGFIFDKKKILLLSFITTGLSIPFFLNVYFTPAIQVLIERFYILPFMFASISSGYGAYWIYTKYLKYRFVSFSIIILLLANILLLLFSNHPKSDLSNNLIVYNYGVNILENIKNSSVLFIYEGDAIVNSVVYLKKTEDLYQGIKAFESEIRVLDNPYGKEYIYLTKNQRKFKRDEIEKDFYNNDKIDLYFVTVGLKDSKEYVQLGLSYKANNRAVETYNIWKRYDYRSINNANKDFRSRQLAANYHYRKALYYMNNKQEDKMLAEAGAFSQLTYDMEWMQNNIGNFYSYNNMPEHEQNAYIAAITINPYFAEGYYNLGVVFASKKQYDIAIKYYEKAVNADNNYIKAIWNLASIYSELGNKEKVVYYLNMYKKNAPNDTAGIEEANKILRSLTGI